MDFCGSTSLSQSQRSLSQYFYYHQKDVIHLSRWIITRWPSPKNFILPKTSKKNTQPLFFFIKVLWHSHPDKVFFMFFPKADSKFQPPPHVLFFNTIVHFRVIVSYVFLLPPAKKKHAIPKKNSPQLMVNCWFVARWFGYLGSPYERDWQPWVYP